MSLFYYIYIRIFIEHRELKYLWNFAKDLDTSEQMNRSHLLKAHGSKLFNAIDLAVNSLDDLKTLVPILIQLGQSHYRLNVREGHFAVSTLNFIYSIVRLLNHIVKAFSFNTLIYSFKPIGNAFIGTLKDGLKAQFTNKAQQAWIKMFRIVESHMKIGMKQAESKTLKSASSMKSLANIPNNQDEN